MTDQSDTRRRSTLPRLRRPEYTGVNRCWPCTLLNGALLVAVAGAVRFLLAPTLAVVVLLVGGALIWLRGYLVPGTPRVAARIPDGVLASEHPPVPDVDPRRDDPTNGDGVVGTLIEHDVVAEDGRGLYLVPAFRERWWDAIRDVRDLPADDLVDELADSLPGVEEVATVEDRGRRWIVISDGSGIEGESWLTPPMAVAEFGAVRAFEEHAPDLDRRTRILAAPPLKPLLDRCPNCETSLETTAAHACCGGPTDVYGGPDEVLACPACDEVVATLDA